MSRPAWPWPSAPGSFVRALEEVVDLEVRVTVVAVLDLVAPADDEKGPRRHISVVTSPNERGVLGLCTRMRDSAFKRSLAELAIGA